MSSLICEFCNLKIKFAEIERALVKTELEVLKWHQSMSHKGNWFNECYGCNRSAVPKSKSYLYLTLSPDKYLRNMDNTPENREALNNWCNNWFANNPKFYGNYTWVIECGSKGNHLHVHAVCEMKNSHKHAEKLKRNWAKHFPNHQLLTTLNLNSKTTKKGEYAYMRFDDPTILKDKLDYFENEKKGSHENLEDLNLRGSRGFLTDN